MEANTHSCVFSLILASKFLQSLHTLSWIQTIWYNQIMIMTVLEGKVSSDKSSILLDAYKETTKDLPPEIVKTYIVKNVENENTWRIITIWRSKEALEEMKKHGTPAGVLMFRSVDTEPTLSIYEVVEYTPKY